MKKILALILAAVLVFAFTSCGSSIRGDVTSSGAEDGFDLGTRTGNVYENKFIGIGFELGDEWTFYTDEQMAELNNISIENASSDKAKEMLKASNIVRDAFATAEDGATLQVIFEKASGAALLLDANAYIGTALTNGTYDAAVSELEANGFTGITTEKSTVTISDKEFPCIVLEAKIGDFTYQQKTIIMKKGSYFVNIAVSALGGTDDIIAKIHTL